LKIIYEEKGRTSGVEREKESCFREDSHTPSPFFLSLSPSVFFKVREMLILFIS